MVATQQLLQTQEIPFSVQGYVTDPKMVGYQILTNYESTYWRALVGNDSWGLYEVLRSFCHEGNATCYPSVNLLLNILGVKQRRVITGWATVVKGKEYRYPGLIEVLQENKLVVAEVQGEGPKMRYVFHVNLTPSLLSDEQLAQLPKVLQKKHGELLERCELALKEMEAKRRPPKIKLEAKKKDPQTEKNSEQNLNTIEAKEEAKEEEKEAKKEPENDDEGGMTNCQRGMTNCHRGSDNLSPEQQQINNTQLTNASARKENNNNSGGDAGQKDSVVVALVDHGISKKVAQRLATRYSKERVLQKIEYLDYLVTERPDKVQKPNGWLRRAIEEDYGAPDGYVSLAERERLAAVEEERAREEKRKAAAAEKRSKVQQRKKQAAHKERIDALRKEHGTTEEDVAFWEEVQREAKYTMPSTVVATLGNAEILRVEEATVLVGVGNTADWRALQHPGTQKSIERTLSHVAGRPVKLQSVELRSLQLHSTDGAKTDILREDIEGNRNT